VRPLSYARLLIGKVQKNGGNEWFCEFSRSPYSLCTTVVSNLWYASPWGYVAVWLGVRKNNIGNGGKHTKKKELN
jgi:hypothetical protein